MKVLRNIYLLEKEILARLMNTLDINSFGYIQYSLYRLRYVVYDHHHNGAQNLFPLQSSELNQSDYSVLHGLNFQSCGTTFYHSICQQYS